MARNLGLKPETLWDSKLALSRCVSKALLAVGLFLELIVCLWKSMNNVLKKTSVAGGSIQ